MANGETKTEAGSADTEITLGVLDAVDSNASVTQRSMAKELGIALGLANSYLKRCVRKGWIKVNQAPPNRYAYYLTPKGFAEKSRLTAEYLSSSFTFFRRARGECEDALAHCVQHEWRRVALVGRSELAETAALCNSEFGLDLVLVDADGEETRFFGLPVVPSLDAAGAIDAALVTDLGRPQAAYESLADRLDPRRIFTASVLKVRRDKADKAMAS
ncbi:MAG: winged helix-turn-helix transcriptional regulator [Bauldia litoralis]